MDWPTNQECYEAMSKFVEYYMVDKQKIYWQKLIDAGLKSGDVPPGKGFLHEIDLVIKSSSKPSMPQRDQLCRLICTVCI